MNLDLASINWVAVGVSALATFFLGGLWYTALFGAARERLSGLGAEKLAELRKARPPHIFLGGMLACYLLLSLTLAILITSFGITGAGAGAALGVVLWVGPALVIGITSWLPSDKPLAMYAIDLAFQFLALVMTGIILAAWR